MPNFFNKSTFQNILRYLIKVAQDKRVVTYGELENMFGLSHNMAGFYAGTIGGFCEDQGWPLLNGLVINATHCKPSSGFDQYLEESDYANWGECLVDCWIYFHITTSREQQVRNVTGLTKLVDDYHTRTSE